MATSPSESIEDASRLVSPRRGMSQPLIRSQFHTKTSSTESVDNASESVSLRRIPRKLILVAEAKMDDKWAKSTFKYCHMFNPNVTSEAFTPGSTELDDWKILCKQMMRDIKNQGVLAGEKEIVRMANKMFNLHMPNDSNSQPRNVSDVAVIIGNQKWYQDDTPRKQDIIYSMIYGLTRTGMDSWILNEEHDWLQNHNVAYKEGREFNNKRKLRGFVYSLLISLFSNTIITHFQRVMTINHKEYITVRYRKSLKEDRGLFTERKFLYGKGYVVRCEAQAQAAISKIEQLKILGGKWVEKCMKKNIRHIDIHNMVDHWYELYSHPKENNNSTVCNVERQVSAKGHTGKLFANKSNLSTLIIRLFYHPILTITDL